MWVCFFVLGTGGGFVFCGELKGTRLGPRGGLEAESFIHTGRHISVAGWCFFSPLFVGATHPPGCSGVEEQVSVEETVTAVAVSWMFSATGCQDP